VWSEIYSCLRNEWKNGIWNTTILTKFLIIETFVCPETYNKNGEFVGGSFTNPGTWMQIAGALLILEEQGIIAIMASVGVLRYWRVLAPGLVVGILLVIVCMMKRMPDTRVLLLEPSSLQGQDNGFYYSNQVVSAFECVEVLYDYLICLIKPFTFK